MRLHAFALRFALALPLPLLFAACSSSSSNPPELASDDGGSSGDDASPLDASSDAADASLDDPPIDPRFQAFATAFDKERQKLGAPGAAVALLENGQVTFFHGFGTKGPNSKDAVRARTLFRIGSMTKSLTATAFLSLVQAGKLDPKSTLLSVVPDAAIPGTELTGLTFDELLSHQSGLYDYLQIDSSHDDAALSAFLTGTTFKGAEYFMDPPGTFWNYSNPNFYLAGLAVERAGGVGYRQAVADRVLTPLGMTRTFFLPSEALADGDYSDGKSTDASGAPWDVKPDSYDNAWARPAGYAFSSVLDYARFVQFLQAGNPAVLADAQRQELLGPKVSTLSVASIEQYAYGLFVDQGFRLGTSYYTTPLVLHGGDIPGFAADFYLVPSTGFGLVAFANADGAHFATSLVLALQSFAGLPAATALPPSFTVDPSVFPAYAATYYDPHNVGHLVVSVNASNVVSVSMPDLDAAKIPYSPTLTPITPGNFVLTVQGQQVELTFVADAAGTYNWIRTRPFAAERTPPGPSPRPGMRVDARALRARLAARL